MPYTKLALPSTAISYKIKFAVKINWENCFTLKYYSKYTYSKLYKQPIINENLADSPPENDCARTSAVKAVLGLTVLVFSSNRCSPRTFLQRP